MKQTDDSNLHRSPVRMGVAWYRKEQWELLRKISEDVDKLEGTYEEWLREATVGLKRMKDIGMEAEKVDIDVNELVAWCKQRGEPVNGSSRSEFAADKIRRKYEEKSGSNNNQ